MKSIRLEGNCSNPTAINVCKRRLLTRHLCTCSRFGLSSSPNHHLSCVISYQSPYREIYHTYRYYLRAHFGQIEIIPGILYIYCIYARTTMMLPRLASGPKPCGGNYNCRRGNHTSNTCRGKSWRQTTNLVAKKTHDYQGDGTSRLVVARSRQPLGKKITIKKSVTYCVVLM